MIPDFPGLPWNFLCLELIISVLPSRPVDSLLTAVPLFIDNIQIRALLSQQCSTFQLPVVFLTIVYSWYSRNFCSCFLVLRSSILQAFTETLRQFQICPQVLYWGYLPICLNYTFPGRIFHFTQIAFAVALPLIYLFKLDRVQLVFISSIFNGKYYRAFTKCLAVYISMSYDSSSSVRCIGKVTKQTGDRASNLG